jgi:MOSC domain-containing protein YiiM
MLTEGVVATRGRVRSIQLGRGVPKPAVETASVTTEGLDGDVQRNRRFHGGPQRAVCLYSWERIEALRAEGHPIDAGTTGENLTLEGIDWTRMVPGVRLTVGEVVLHLTDYAHPCATIRPSFADDDSNRIGQKLHPGWSRLYARVEKPGRVTVGDTVTLD